MDGRPETLDQIARVLSVFKDGDELERELRALGLPGGETAVQALLDISFDKFHALSLKALRRIVPHMEKACATTKPWRPFRNTGITASCKSRKKASRNTCRRFYSGPRQGRAHAVQ
jgi:hypothetical protein